MAGSGANDDLAPHRRAPELARLLEAVLLVVMESCLLVSAFARTRHEIGIINLFGIFSRSHVLK